MALTQAQIDEMNKKYAEGTSSKGVYGTQEQFKDLNQKLSSDAAFRQAELERATKVLNEFKSSGRDTSEQVNYINKINQLNAQQPQTTQVAQPRVESLQEQLANAQRQATLSALDKARSSSLQALQQEQAQLTPQYAAQRSQARAQSERGAQSFADFMAQRGLSSSGGSALGETQRLGALQGAVGALQQQEQAALGNIASRRTGIEQGYQSDIAAAEAGIQAQALQNAINQANADKQFALQEAGLTGLYGGNQTLAAQAQAAQKALQEASLTGQYGGQQTLQAQSQQFNQDLASKQFEQGVREFEANYGLNLRQQTFAEAQAAVQNAIAKGQLSISQGNLALNQAKYLADNDPNSLDNQYKQAQINKLNAPVTQEIDIKPYRDTIESLFISNDPITNQPVLNENALRQYLTNISQSGVPDATVLQIASYYGLTPGQSVPEIPLNQNTISNFSFNR